MLLHTADWHLGKILDGVSLLPDQWDWFMRFCDSAAAKQPQLILIAGDLFDFGGRNAQAKALFDAIMDRLTTQCGCPIAAIPGNHDDVGWLKACFAPYTEKGLLLIDSVFAPPLQFTVDSFPVLLYAIPYLTAKELNALGADTVQQAMERIFARMKAQMPGGAYTIAMAHGLILPQGNEAVDRLLAANHDSGATLVDSALFSGFDYTALGHIHANLFAEYRCYYAGSPLIYEQKEIGQPKGYNAVYFTQNGTVLQRLSLPPVHPVLRLTGSFDALLQDPPAQARDAYLYLELTDTVPKKDGMQRLKQCFPHLLRLRYASESEVIFPESSSISGQFGAFLSHCGEQISKEEWELFLQLEE